MEKDIYNKSTYFYELPPHLIAQSPLDRRDNSRLLVYDRANKTITHKHFYDVLDYLNEGDVLVINNTKVIPARLIGIKEETGAKAEVFLLKKLDDKKWEVLLKPQKRLKVGTHIVFGDGELRATVLEHHAMGNSVVEFEFEGVFEEPRKGGAAHATKEKTV